MLLQDLRRDVSDDETLLLEWLAERGVPSVVALTNGAAEQTCHSAAAPVVDYSYTLLQMVGQE